MTLLSTQALLKVCHTVTRFFLPQQQGLFPMCILFYNTKINERFFLNNRLDILVVAIYGGVYFTNLKLKSLQ